MSSAWSGCGGGSKKGVYRVHTDGSPVTRVIVYSWAEDENFWPGIGDNAGTALALPPH